VRNRARERFEDILNEEKEKMKEQEEEVDMFND